MMGFSAICLSFLALSSSTEATSNPWLDNCQVSLFDGEGFTDDSFGPFSVGEYDAGNGDFDDDSIESLNLSFYSNFTCWVYLFQKTSFEKSVILVTSNLSYPSERGVTTAADVNGSASGEIMVWNLDTFESSWNDKVSSMKVYYESDLCLASFYDNDHQGNQLGNTVGIAGTYTKEMMKIHGITENAITSLGIEGDDSCYVQLYSDDDCSSDKLMATVNGTGDYSKSELENLGFSDNDVECFIIGAKSGLSSLTWLTDSYSVTNESITAASTQSYSNPSATIITTTMTFETSETLSWSFNEEESFSTTTTAQVSIGIPELGASASLKISYTEDETWSTGYSGSSTSDFSESIDVQIAPYSSVTCGLYLSTADLAVPYTAVFQGIDQYGLYYTTNVTSKFTTNSYYAASVECKDTTTVAPTVEATSPVTTENINGTVSTVDSEDSSGSAAGDVKSGSKVDATTAEAMVIIVVVGVVLSVLAVTALGFYCVKKRYEAQTLKVKLLENENDVEANGPDYERL